MAYAAPRHAWTNFDYDRFKDRGKSLYWVYDIRIGPGLFFHVRLPILAISLYWNWQRHHIFIAPVWGFHLMVGKADTVQEGQLLYKWGREYLYTIRRLN